MSGEERDVGCHGIVFSWKPEVGRAKALASLLLWRGRKEAGCRALEAAVVFPITLHCETSHTPSSRCPPPPSTVLPFPFPHLPKTEVI